MNLLELLSVLPVSFYFATSRNDAGIYEQGSATGKACALLCRNSRYVEYAERGHFWVLPDDSTGRGDESMRDWLCAVIRAR